MLRVDHLRKVYESPAGDVEAIADISFTMDAGELVCIVGPSGCGKTTLLKCIAGLLRPSGGIATKKKGQREQQSHPAHGYKCIPTVLCLLSRRADLITHLARGAIERRKLNRPRSENGPDLVTVHFNRVCEASPDDARHHQAWK